MTRLYRGPVFDVERRESRDVVVYGPTVAIVAVDTDECVALVRQPRVPAGGLVLELPAGGVEEGEAPLETARRELAEETGWYGGEWTEVATFFTSPGYSDEQMHLFLATGVAHGEPRPECDEEIELVRVPLDEVPSLIEECDDGKTLVGLLLLVHFGTDGTLPRA